MFCSGSALVYNLHPSLSAGNCTPERHNRILVALNSKYLLSLDNLLVTRFREGTPHLSSVTAEKKTPDTDMCCTLAL